MIWQSEEDPMCTTVQDLDVLTVVLLAFLTIIATFFTDLGFINAVAVAVVATAVATEFSTCMFTAAMRSLKELPTSSQRCEVTFSQILIVLGSPLVFWASSRKFCCKNCQTLLQTDMNRLWPLRDIAVKQ